MLVLYVPGSGGGGPPAAPTPGNPCWFFLSPSGKSVLNPHGYITDQGLENSALVVRGENDKRHVAWSLFRTGDIIQSFGGGNQLSGSLGWFQAIGGETLD